MFPALHAWSVALVLHSCWDQSLPDTNMSSTDTRHGASLRMWCTLATNSSDVVKRPISAVADNFEVRNAKNVTIKVDKKISFNLLYNKNNSLYKKIKIEQARKETNNNKIKLICN